MSELTASTPSKTEQHLDGAYSRVLRVTISLGAVAAVITSFVAGWGNALGLLAGVFLGLLNLVWLHRAADLLVRRMMADRAQASSRTEASAPLAAQGAADPLKQTDGGRDAAYYVSTLRDSGREPLSSPKEKKEVNVPPAFEGLSSAAEGLPPAAEGPSKPRVMLSFPLRYLLMIAAICAIVKGYPRVLVSFIVGLALPMLAFMGEGIYEAITLQQDRPRQP